MRLFEMLLSELRVYKLGEGFLSRRGCIYERALAANISAVGLSIILNRFGQGRYTIW